MEQIPTEVIEKIIAEAKKHQLGQYVWQEDKRKSFALGASYGYQLASPCALCEGKEKEIVQIQEAIDRAANILDEKGKQIFLLNKDLLESLRVNSEQSQRISKLEAENERLKGLMRKAWKYGGYDCECETCQTIWQQFKTENGL